MKTKIFQPKSPDTPYAVRHVASFAINLPVEKIDLYKWMIEMQDSDYASYSTSHQAMGSFFKDGVYHAINVENIGNEYIIQRYAMKFHSADHVQLYSSDTTAYIMRWFPATVGVPWEMQVRPVSENSCELICLVGADFPNRFLQVAAWCNGLGGFFLRRHLLEEGKAFAADIEKKFK